MIVDAVEKKGTQNCILYPWLPKGHLFPMNYETLI